MNEPGWWKNVLKFYAAQELYNLRDSSVPTVVPASSDEFLCYECNKFFGSRCALSAHQRVHGFRHSLRYKIVSRTCACCNLVYSSSEKLFRHLYYQKSQACALHYEQHVPDASCDDIAAFQVADIAAVKKQRVRRALQSRPFPDSTLHQQSLSSSSPHPSSPPPPHPSGHV